MPKAPRTPKNSAPQIQPTGKAVRGLKSSSTGQGQWDSTDEGGKSDGQFCPLCIEPLDATERDFYPCPCGYQVCLFCYEKLRNECNKMCPGCRQPYNEDPSVNYPPPPRSIEEPARLSKYHGSPATQVTAPRRARLPIYSNRLASWSQDSNRINKAPSDNEKSVYNHVQSKPVANGIKHSSSSLVQSQSPPSSPVLEEQRNQDKIQSVEGLHTSSRVSASMPMQGSVVAPHDGGQRSNQTESRSKDKQEVEINNSNFSNKDSAAVPVASKPNQEVSNFLSMLKSSSEKNIGIKLDANITAIPPPPGFGPPGFSTPQRTALKDIKLQQTSMPQQTNILQVVQGLQSNLIVSEPLERPIPISTPQPIQPPQPTPLKYNNNPLGVIGSSRLVSDIKDSSYIDKLENQRVIEKPAVSPLGGSSGTILSQLQALWKDEGASQAGVVGGGSNSSNTNTVSMNNGIGRGLDHQGCSLFSGGLWTPTATSGSNNINNSLWQQQPQLVSNGLNFGLDTESALKGLANQNTISNKNSLLWRAMQMQQNGLRQQYPNNMDGFIGGSQLANNISQLNNNPLQLNSSPLQGAGNSFLNHSILDNVGNNSLSNSSLFQATNNQFANNLGIANLGQNRSGRGVQPSLQQQSQQTHDLNVLLQQLQQGGNRQNRGGSSNSGNGGLFQNFPTM